MPDNPSPEIGLLLACLARSPARDLARAIPAWAPVLAAAQWHGILPLVYWHLHSDCPDAVPPPVLAQLRTAYHQNAAHNLLLAAELLAVLKHLAPIPAMPLKGPALAFSVYENSALRHFEDLDILVPRAHARAAMEALARAGYTPALPLTGSTLSAYLHTNYEMRFDRPNGPCPVELHWGLQEEKFFSPALTSEPWWTRPATVTIAGTQVPTPAPADLLLFLSAHGAKHLWERLKWTADIAALAPTVDLPELRAQARKMRLEPLLQLALSLANYPVNDPKIESLTNQIKNRLNTPHRPTLKTTAQFHLALHPNPLRYLAMNLFIPTAAEYKLIQLPKLLTPLYYPLRALRLMHSLTTNH